MSSPSAAIDRPEPLPPAGAARPRLDSIDLLRGLIMVLMALDHARDFFTNALFDPLDLKQTTTALFLTRWFTHFCAPNFIFLAGVGAFLTRTRGRTTREVSWFLFSRGLWLVFLETTWVRSLGWNFNFDYSYVSVGVLWSIGWSMMALSALVYLPVPAVTGIGLSMIALHNLTDGIQPEQLGRAGWLWTLLHTVSTKLQITPNFRLDVWYPLIPWMGVLAAGYGFGTLFTWETERRRKWLIRLGLAVTALFVILRGINGYGNPVELEPGKPLPNGRWSVQANALLTLFSFLDVRKNPASLDFLLMTIGPALMILACFDRRIPAMLRPFLVFGRVPLFYYLLHLPLLHGMVVIAEWFRHGRADWLFVTPPADPKVAPPGFGFALPGVYVAWILSVLLLYPVCRWFANFKRGRKDAWLSYL